MTRRSPTPVKDEDKEHPIATAWRPVLVEVVNALARGDYKLKAGISGVSPITAPVAKQIREYIAEYGETLVELPAETWKTSVAQWMGTHWELLVDLWTAESGLSDLVLHARAKESERGYVFEITSVHVP